MKKYNIPRPCQITNAVYLDGYTFLLTFNKKEKRLVNIEPYLEKWLFKKLQNPAVCAKFTLDGISINWLNDQIGIDPKELYKMGVPIESFKAIWLWRIWVAKEAYTHTKKMVVEK